MSASSSDDTVRSSLVSILEVNDIQTGAELSVCCWRALMWACYQYRPWLYGLSIIHGIAMSRSSCEILAAINAPG